MIIYKIANTVSLKVYVGQTVQELKKRWTHHQWKARSGKQHPLYAAMRSYGLAAFSIEILEILPNTTTQEELNAKERHWIQTLNCIHPNGYNCTSGGDGKFFSSQETKDKISRANKGRKLTQEQKDHLSKVLTGAVGSNLGRKWSDEIKANMAKAQIGKKASEESKAKMSASAKLARAKRKLLGLSKSEQAALTKLHAFNAGKSPWNKDKKPGLFARLMKEVAPATGLTQHIYVLTGPSGIGKSWVADQLKDKFCVLERDGVGKSQLWLQLNKEVVKDKPILLGLPVAASTAKKNLESLGYVVSIIQIVEIKEVILQRRMLRNSTSSSTIKAVGPMVTALFTGTSQECLDFLKSV